MIPIFPFIFLVPLPLLPVIITKLEYLVGRGFAPRPQRSSSWQLRGVRLPDSGRVAGARQRIQRFPVRVAIEPVQGQVSAQFARKSQG